MSEELKRAQDACDGMSKGATAIAMIALVLVREITIASTNEMDESELAAIDKLYATWRESIGSEQEAVND